VASFGGAGLVVVDGAGGVALSDCWASAAGGKILTIAIATAPIVANGSRFGTGPNVGTDAPVRLMWQRSSRAVGPVIPSPWIELKKTTRTNITQIGLRA
jgi:hypothetical protein